MEYTSESLIEMLLIGGGFCAWLITASELIFKLTIISSLVFILIEIINLKEGKKKPQKESKNKNEKEIK